MTAVADKPHRTPTWLVVVLTLGSFVLLASLPMARSFLFQPFNMPSSSMKPTLLMGDYFFVSKSAYGYSRFSLPFSPPLFSGRIFGAEPRYGDVVVFRLPRDTSIDYVKRVVGLPGDRVQMIDGQLYLNGNPVPRERLPDVSYEGRPAKRWRETLPNGAQYVTLDLTNNGFLDNTNLYVVPAGNYFMLGDNRDNSLDSRVLTQLGYVPFENLVGRADIIFWSVGAGANGDRPVRRDRIGRWVQ
jgi:signal peptidase I